MLVVVIAEHGCAGILVMRCTLEIGYAVGSLLIDIVGAGHIVLLVGGSVDIGIIAVTAGAERDALDLMHRGEEHTCSLLLTVDINRRIAVGEIHVNLHMICLSGLIVQNLSVTGATLRAELPFRSKVKTRACRSLVVEELDLQLAVIILVRHEVELHGKIFRGRNLSLDFRDVVWILVGKGEPCLALFLRK